MMEKIGSLKERSVNGRTGFETLLWTAERNAFLKSDMIPIDSGK